MKKFTKRITCYVLMFTLFTVLLTNKVNIFASDSYFTDNFESGYKQWEVQRGDWKSITDGSNVLQHSSKSTEGRITRGEMDWSDYTVEADVKVLDFNKSNRAMLAGRYADGNNYYAVSLSGKNDGMIELRKKVAGSSTVITQVETRLVENQWYNVKLEMNGNQLKVYLDDKLVIEATDDSLTSGAVGLVSNKVIVNYDNLVVTKNGDSDTQQPEIKPEEPEVKPEEPEVKPEKPEVSPEEPIMTTYFVEAFESGISSWEIQRGDWTIGSDKSKVLQYLSTSTEGRIARGDQNWSDYTVEADLKVLDFNGSNRAMLAGRYVDGNNYYAVSLSGKNDGMIELRKKVAGSSTVITQVETRLVENQWYNVKLEMNGNQLKVYLDDKLVLEASDNSLTSGAVGLISSKVSVSYDNVMVNGNGDSSTPEQPEIKPEEPEVKPEEPEVKPEQPEIKPETNSSQYSVEGFATGVTGGGQLDESSPYYVKVTTAKELGEALTKGSKVRVIEIMNDIDLGWNMIGSSAQKAPFSKHADALTHPILKKTGVSKIEIDGFDGLTIFSKNGSKLTHGALVFKRSSNILIRNIEFDELWEWDEATKGKYDRNDWDFITLEKSRKIWIDHCTFGKAYDGVVDSKKGTDGLTISWSKFLPGEGEFYEAMFKELEANKAAYPMYKFLRDNKLSQETIMAVAAPQKKTHLIGATEMASDNKDLEVTLHHNYYLDSQDRLPRLRAGNAHAYNIVMDSRGAYEASKLIPSSVATAIKNKGYSFQITSNGAISTEGGAVLVENSVILGIKYPLRNNQKSASNTAYTGKIKAVDTIYEYGNTTYRGNSTDKNSPLSPEPANSLTFSWNGFSKLPYSYQLDDPSTLQVSLQKLTGSGVVSMNWLKTTY